MNFLTKAKLKLAKLTKVDLSSVTLDEITLYYFEDGDLEEGYEVFILDEEGAYILPPDGEYGYGDKVVVVTQGIVENISPSESTGDLTKTDGKLETEVPSKEDFEKLTEAVSDLTDVVEGLGGNVDKVQQELELSRQAHEETKKELEATKQELKLAKESSKRDFTNPYPEGTPGNPGKKDSSFAVSQLEKFGL